MSHQLFIEARLAWLQAVEEATRMESIICWCERHANTNEKASFFAGRERKIQLFQEMERLRPFMVRENLRQLGLDDPQVFGVRTRPDETAGLPNKTSLLSDLVGWAQLPGEPPTARAVDSKPIRVIGQNMGPQGLKGTVTHSDLGLIDNQGWFFMKGCTMMERVLGWAWVSDLGRHQPLTMAARDYLETCSEALLRAVRDGDVNDRNKHDGQFDRALQEAFVIGQTCTGADAMEAFRDLLWQQAVKVVTGSDGLHVPSLPV